MYYKVRTELNLITLLTGSAGVRQQHGGLRRGRLQHLHQVSGCRRPQEHSRHPQLGRDPLREVRGGRESTGSCNNVRDSIAMEMKLTLDAATCPWGVLVERVEVKDVRVPEQLQRAMAAEAEAAREARAKVIAAEGEHKASRALKHAADIITESPGALQVLKHFRRQYSILLSAAIPPNPQSHRRREQLHHHLPGPRGHHLLLHRRGRSGESERNSQRLDPNLFKAGKTKD